MRSTFHSKPLNLLRPIVTLYFGLFLLPFASCSKKLTTLSAPPSKSISLEYQSPSLPTESERFEMGRAMAGGQRRQLSGPLPKARAASEDADFVAEPSPAVSQTPSLPQKRMVAREGTIESRAPQPDSLVIQAAAITESAGGYVESQTRNSAILRVPVEVFSKVFDSLLTLGQVISHRTTAEDITDAFTDAQARILVLEKTIERYVRLVAMAKDESEKLRLLREIQNLRIQLEELEVQKNVLSKRAQYSRISLTVQGIDPNARYSYDGEVKGFHWIRMLDPHSVRRLGKNLDLVVPQEMVLVQKRSPWLVEAAGGSRMWTARIENYPKGDTRFWVRAIVHRVKNEYAQFDTTTAGAYTIIRLRPFPGSHYSYDIAVQAKGKHVHVVQIYYPDAVQLQRLRKKVEAVFTGEGV